MNPTAPVPLSMSICNFEPDVDIDDEEQATAT